jgi:hypothetical protein
MALPTRGGIDLKARGAVGIRSPENGRGPRAAASARGPGHVLTASATSS